MAIIQDNLQVTRHYTTRPISDNPSPPEYPSLSRTKIDELMNLLKEKGIEVSKQDSTKQIYDEHQQHVTLSLDEPEIKGSLEGLVLQSNGLKISITDYNDSGGRLSKKGNDVIGGETHHERGIQAELQYTGEHKVGTEEIKKAKDIITEFYSKLKSTSLFDL